MIKINDNSRISEVSLYGKCEQRNLPAGYQQVEYLESSGTQYIDTGYALTTDNFEIIGSGAKKADAGTFFGARNLTAPYTGIIESRLSNSLISFWAGGSWMRFSALQNTKYNFKIACSSNLDCVATCSGFTDKTFTATQTYVNGSNIYLFANNPVVQADAVDIYSFSIKDNGVLVRNLIPAKRNSDNVLGMYDTVSGTFFTNAGTGTFTAGADVTPSPENPIDIVCNNGVLKVSKNLLNANVASMSQNKSPSSPISINFDRWYKGVAYNGYMNTISVSSFSSGVGTITFTSNDVNYGCVRFVKLKPNTDYVVSCSNSHSRCAIMCYVDNGNNTYTATTQIKTPCQLPLRFTTNDNVVYGILLYANTSITYTNLQLETGSNATLYRPYGTVYADGTQEVVTDSVGNTATAEMLLAVGDYKDTQEVLAGSVTRKVGIKVLDGTEDWQNLSEYMNISKTDLGTNSTILPLNSTNIFCTHFKHKRNSFTDGFGVGSSYVNFKYDSLFTTLEQWKQYLADQYNAGTPVIIAYPLATPTTESVTPQPLSGSTVTQTAGSIDNMEFDVKHLFDLKKRYITNSNGVPHEAKKVYSGNELIHLHINQNTQFKFRTTSGNDIRDGKPITADIEKIEGLTVAWNQLIDNGDFSDGNSGWQTCGRGGVAIGGTVTYTANYGVRIDGETSTNDSHIFHITAPIPIAHKYFARATVQCSKEVYVKFGYFANEWSFLTKIAANKKTVVKAILEGFASGMLYKFGVHMTYKLNIGEWFELYNLSLIDLTLIYGAGNEPTTPEQFEADYFRWFGKPLTYEPYDEGSLRSVKMSGLKSVGFNQWDEEWEDGAMNTTTGVNVANNKAKRSKNFINVLPNTQYYCFYNGGTSDTVWCLFYDSNMDVIEGYKTGRYYNVNASNIKDTIFSTPSNCKYIRFYCKKDTEKININLSWSVVKDGTYLPYEENTISIPTTTMTGKLNGEGESVVIFQQGMGKWDSIYYSGGKTYASVGGQFRAYQDGDVTGDTMITDGRTTTYEKLTTPLIYEVDDFTLPVRYQVNDFGTEKTVSVSEQDVNPVLNIDYKLDLS